MIADKDILEKMILTYDAQQRIEEVVWFYNHAAALNPKVVVEIGTKEGGNFKILSTLLPKDGVAVGIDQRKDLPWKMNDSECEVHYISRDSHDVKTVELLKGILNGAKIDVLFIDGDHSTKGMLQDFEDYSELVRDGGIIAVHDIYYLVEVAAAWDAIPGKKYESEKTQSSIGIGFIYK